jgi:hypothetical protein
LLAGEFCFFPLTRTIQIYYYCVILLFTTERDWWYFSGFKVLVFDSLGCLCLIKLIHNNGLRKVLVIDKCVIWNTRQNSHMVQGHTEKSAAVHAKLGSVINLLRDLLKVT